MKHLPALLALIVLFFSNLSVAQKFPDDKYHAELQKGIEFLVSENYTSAKQVFEGLDRNYQDIPLAKIYLASCDVVKTYDLGVPFNKWQIDKYLTEAEKQSQQLLDDDDGNVWYNYYMAFTLSTKAYYNSMNDNWFTGFTVGLEAVKYFKKCGELNPSFSDATSSVAIYEYWKSRKTEMLSWLPGFSNKTEEAIKILEKNINTFSYAKYNVINQLIWIYIDKKDFNSAIRLSQQALQVYPNSRTFKWALARAYEDINKNKSVEIYYSILKTLEWQHIQSNYTVITAKHKIAQDYKALGDKAAAIKLCNEILSITNLTDYEKSSLEERLKKVQKLRDELTN